MACSLNHSLFNFLSKENQERIQNELKEVKGTSFLIKIQSWSHLLANKFIVSKETVGLRWWESEARKFGFMKGIDKGPISTLKELES